MNITECSSEDGSEFHFEEVSVNAAPDCPVTADQFDALFEAAIDVFINTFFFTRPNIPDCSSGLIGVVTNYYKRNCFKLCQSSSFIPLDRELVYSFGIQCDLDGGCCISTKYWCRGSDGLAEPIEYFTTTITGTCEAKLKCPEDEVFFNTHDCIVSRCE